MRTRATASGFKSVTSVTKLHHGFAREALVSRLRIAASFAARSHGNPETKGH
jgi:hypothetical protein